MDQLPAKLKAEVCNFVEYGDSKVARPTLQHELYLKSFGLPKRPSTSLKTLHTMKDFACVQTIVLHSEQIPQTIEWI